MLINGLRLEICDPVRILLAFKGKLSQFTGLNLLGGIRCRVYPWYRFELSCKKLAGVIKVD